MPLRVILLAIGAAVTYAQQGICDRELIGLANPLNPLRYMQRGSRCEGIYDPERAGEAPISLVSLTSSFTPFNPQQDKNLYVRWTAPGNMRVNVRSYSLKPDTYYQMDAQIESVNVPFTWPLDLLRDIGLRRRDLALVAWTSYTAGQVRCDLYLPVVITSQSSGNAPTGVPEVKLLPGRSLNEIYLTVEALRSNLTSSKVLLNDEPYGEGPYPAEVPISLAWKRLKIAEPGFYLLKIGATVVDGTPVTIQLTIYYAP